ncbi:MAG TPA: cation:proton antiporter, partial [Candidatus Jeotgalibaca merdavium]|nr:cation:proton antiporter [Candidatus Jeotgalibaca merdavium]
MLTSIGLLLVVGLFFGRICKRIGLPALIGMMVAGVLLGPFGLNTFSTSLLDLSAELRQVALIVILTRAGLSLDLKQLKKVGTSALLMSFLPATFEIVSIAVLAPLLLGMDLVSALVLGAVLAAVSPAVVVPRMLKLIDEGYGKEAAVPQLIISGASLDDVFVIVLFTAFSSLSLSQDLQLKTLLSIPLSIIAGVAVGYVVGKGVSWLFRYYRMRDSVKLA